jgi:hypothetical protein
MTNMRRYGAAIALALLMGAVSSPSFAQTKVYADSPEHISAARAAALQECNARAEKYLQHTWGNYQLYVYRACMAEHGQAE